MVGNDANMHVECTHYPMKVETEPALVSEYIAEMLLVEVGSFVPQNKWGPHLLDDLDPKRRTWLADQPAK